jgi:hypothetical protein
MKTKQLFIALLFTVSLSAFSTSFAQVKIGNNPTVIDGNSSLEVEASTANRALKIDKSTGQLTLKDGTEGAGKVLSSDANGNASWSSPASATEVNFFAFFTGTQTTNATVTNKINFATANPNVGNGFNTTTDRFVAPVAGIYYFIGTAYVHTGITTVGTYKDVMSIKVNGVPIITQDNYQYRNGGAGNAFTIPLLVRLNVGDYVELFAHSDKPGAYFAGESGSINAPQTTFQGFLIGK